MLNLSSSTEINVSVSVKNKYNVKVVVEKQILGGLTKVAAY